MVAGTGVSVGPALQIYEKPPEQVLFNISCFRAENFVSLLVAKGRATVVRPLFVDFSGIFRKKKTVFRAKMQVMVC